MKYKCPKCGAMADQAGNCPTCQVPMVEVTESAPATEPQKPEEGGSAPTSA